MVMLRGCQKSGFLITLLTGLLNMASALVEGHANHGLTVCERMLLIDRACMNMMASDRKLWRELIRHKREFLGAGHSNDRGNLTKYKYKYL